MIESTQIHRASCCGKRAMGAEMNPARPEGLAGHADGVKGRHSWLMGTVDVPAGDGTSFKTEPWIACSPAHVRRAVENTLEGLYGSQEGADADAVADTPEINQDATE